ncbi:MAG: alpha/beta fold hydrolase [Myxococcales bacterium]|nr:alpha/beta fold hydrolase [Myxococcales bacterium]
MLEHISRNPAKRTKHTPLLFQHGAWHGAWCWEHWLQHFSELGYEVHALSLPGHGASPLGKPHVNRYTLGDYAECLAEVVAEISPTPAIIGHSLGGAVTQRLLETHTVPAAVLLATLPQRGLMPYLLRSLRHNTRTTLKAILTLNTHHIVNSADKVLSNFFSEDAVVDLEAWEAKLVRESFGVLLTTLTPIADPTKLRETPLLVVAGGKDEVFTVEEETQTAKAYGAELLVFPDQAHNLMAEPRWREVADAIDDWLSETLGLE